MLEPFRHWFTPHHTNNYRPKLLHTSGLVLVLALAILFNSTTRLLSSRALHILGFTSSITVEEVIAQTNERRVTEGLPPLKISAKLSSAAAAKAADMFADNYWSHTAPDGTTPWDFINSSGYKYIYAGENLAKDFSTTSRMIQAWMDSPTHRDNIISPKYSELGIAVVPGVLNGEETVLVVQMFGTTAVTNAAQGQILAQDNDTTSTPAPKQASVNIQATPPPVQQPELQPESAELETVPVIAQAQTGLTPQPFLDLFSVEKAASLFTTVLLLIVLLIDLVAAESNKLSRRVGKNWAHLIFISFVLILISIVNAGAIL